MKGYLSLKWVNFLQEIEQLRSSESALKERESQLCAELQEMVAEKLSLTEQLAATTPKQKNWNKMKELQKDFEKSLNDRDAEIDRLRKLVSDSTLKQSGMNVLDLQRQIERQQTQLQSREAEVGLLQKSIETKNQVLHLSTLSRPNSTQAKLELYRLKFMLKINIFSPLRSHGITFCASKWKALQAGKLSSFCLNWHSKALNLMPCIRKYISNFV